MDTRSESDTSPELNDFAKHCLSTNATCITFNYDDLFDEALYSTSDSDLSLSWDPCSGYGFICQPASSVISEQLNDSRTKSQISLLKLHGSVNWRTKLGSQSPYSLDSICHYSDWLRGFDSSGFLDQRLLERHLDNTPVITPPVLSKSRFISQPVFRLIWTLAFEKLSNADEVVFLGYSLPTTDTAAHTLFLEALADIPSTSIRIVDKPAKLEDTEQLISRYRTISSEIPDENFFLDGAIEWVRQLRNDS